MARNSDALSSGERQRGRLKEGTDLAAVENLDYIVQLMAAVESLRASCRWLIHVQNAKSALERSDVLNVVIAGAGWCGEAFCILKDGSTRTIIDRTMIASDGDFVTLWDRILSAQPDTTIKKIHHIRSNYFAHFGDKKGKVFERFFEWQSTKREKESFIESDCNGKFLHTRYLWPQLAFYYDLIGDPEDESNKDAMNAFMDDLGKIWRQTANLLARLVAELLEARGLSFDPVTES